MSSDRTFYINKQSLDEKKIKIEKDHWDGREDWALEELYMTLDEQPDIIFKKMSIVIKWYEWSEQCEKFRTILNRYEIEYSEQL